MSRRFCEACGREAGTADAFCAECGQRLPSLEVSPQRSAAPSPATWFTGGFRRGEPAPDLPPAVPVQLWVTHSRRLSEQIGSEAAVEILRQLRERTGLREQHCALLVDLADDFGTHAATWQDCVEVLRTAEARLQESVGRGFAALGLVGDEQVVPQAIFRDLTESDPQVETDAVYASLSAGDPWEEESARQFTRAVGRLPAGSGWGVEALAHYWQNRDQAAGQPTPRSLPFGLSARCWEAASQAVLQALGGGLVQSSPVLDHASLPSRWDTRSPWQYFNLHGSMVEPGWYGEHAGDYPVAFLPALATRLQSLNVIGVEACYGARFGGLNADASVLLSALSHLTVAFLGSSRIAYGPSRPPNRLADVMVRDFLLAMRQGHTAGVAHLHARHAVAESMAQPDMDPHLAIKTLLSFNLFGDPSVVMGRRPTGLARLDAPPRVVLLDTLTPVQEAVRQSMADLEQRLQTLLANQHPALREVRPQVSSLQGRGGPRHRWHWAASVGPLQRHWVFLTDAQGKVLGQYESR